MFANPPPPVPLTQISPIQTSPYTTTTMRRQSTDMDYRKDDPMPANFRNTQAHLARDAANAALEKRKNGKWLSKVFQRSNSTSDAAEGTLTQQQLQLQLQEPQRRSSGASVTEASTICSASMPGSVWTHGTSLSSSKWNSANASPADISMVDLNNAMAVRRLSGMNPADHNNNPMDRRGSFSMLDQGTTTVGHFATSRRVSFSENDANVFTDESNASSFLLPEDDRYNAEKLRVKKSTDGGKQTLNKIQAKLNQISRGGGGRSMSMPDVDDPLSSTSSNSHNSSDSWPNHQHQQQQQRGRESVAPPTRRRRSSARIAKSPKRAHSQPRTPPSYMDGNSGHSTKTVQAIQNRRRKSFINAPLQPGAPLSPSPPPASSPKERRSRSRPRSGKSPRRAQSESRKSAAHAHKDTNAAGAVWKGEQELSEAEKRRRLLQEREKTMRTRNRRRASENAKLTRVAAEVAMDSSDDMDDDLHASSPVLLFRRKLQTGKILAQTTVIAQPQDKMSALVKRLQGVGGDDDSLGVAHSSVLTFSDEEVAALKKGDLHVVFSLRHVKGVKFGKEEFGRITAEKIFSFTKRRPLVIDIMTEKRVKGEKLNLF